MMRLIIFEFSRFALESINLAVLWDEENAKIL
jgi:hypothetical protein